MRVAVLIDRVEALWTLCTFDDQDYRPVDEAWSKELAAELAWLNDLYAEALANEGDVRRCLSLAPRSVPADSKPRDTNVQ